MCTVCMGTYVNEYCVLYVLMHTDDISIDVHLAVLLREPEGLVVAARRYEELNGGREVLRAQVVPRHEPRAVQRVRRIDHSHRLLQVVQVLETHSAYPNQ